MDRLLAQWHPQHFHRTYLILPRHHIVDVDLVQKKYGTLLPPMQMAASRVGVVSLGFRPIEAMMKWVLAQELVKNSPADAALLVIQTNATLLRHQHPLLRLLP